MSVLRQMVARDPGDLDRSGQRDCPRLGDGCVSPRDFIWAWARFIAEFLFYDCRDLVAMGEPYMASAFDNDDAVYRIFTIVIMSGTFRRRCTHILETMDFTYGVIGWIVMRIGMVGLWLRAAAHSPEYRCPDLCNWVDHCTGALGGDVFHGHPRKCEFHPNIRGYFRD